MATSQEQHSHRAIQQASGAHSFGQFLLQVPTRSAPKCPRPRYTANICHGAAAGPGQWLDSLYFKHVLLSECR